jgi:hypothetical protein
MPVLYKGIKSVFIILFNLFVLVLGVWPDKKF